VKKFKVLIIIAILFLVIVGKGTESVFANTLCVFQEQIPDAECEALDDLYYSTDGINWRYNADWFLTDTP
jgi:hypothetical protein